MSSKIEEGQQPRGEKKNQSPPITSSLPLFGSAPRALSSSPTRRVNISGIAVDDLTEDEAVAHIDRLVARGGPHYMSVVNAAKIVAASRDEKLRRVLAEADLVTADGMSVVWASRALGQPLRERVTGIDLFDRLVEHAARRGLRVYFLGARDEAVRGVVEHFARKHTNLQVAGYRNGYFTAQESNEIVEEIRSGAADLLFVAMGSPAQEYWIASNTERAGVRFALGVGGSFDHLSGQARRAPRWMQRAGIEWLHRLMREPRRLWKRYLIGNTLFIWLILRQAVKGKNFKGK